MTKEEIIPELKDLLEMVNNYNHFHKDGCFLFSFVGFKKSPEHKCVDCGDPTDIYDPNKSIQGAYGDRETLQILVNQLQELIILEQDEDGFVNV